MSCNDHNAVETEHGLCRVTKYAYAGETTDEDGVLTTGTYVGEEVGRCDTNSFAYFAQIPAEVTFTAEEVAEMRGFYEDVPAGTDQVILDGNKGKRGVVCIRMDQKTVAKETITKLFDDKLCEGLFQSNGEEKCEALRKTLNNGFKDKFKEDPPQSIESEIRSGVLEVIGWILLVIGGGGLTFGVAVPWLQKWFGPRGGGGHGGTPHPFSPDRQEPPGYSERITQEWQQRYEEAERRWSTPPYDPPLEQDWLDELVMGGLFGGLGSLAARGGRAVIGGLVSSLADEVTVPVVRSLLNGVGGGIRIPAFGF